VLENTGYMDVLVRAGCRELIRNWGPDGGRLVGLGGVGGVAAGGAVGREKRNGELGLFAFV